MFIGKTYHFLKNKLAKRFILPLTICLVFLQNPSVYAGIILNDATIDNLGTPSVLNYTNGENDTTDLGAVIIIQNSAPNLNIQIGGNQINAGYANAGDADSNLTKPNIDKINAFYSSPTGEHTFDDSDHIAILNLTNNNTTFTTSRGGIDGILGNIVLRGGDNNILGTGPGDIIGSVDTGDGNDVIDFSGIAWIHSDVNLRNGNNSVTITSTAFIDGNLSMGTGDDSVYIAGTAFVDDINITGGTNTLTLEEQGRIRGSVNTGAGVDTLTINEQGFIAAGANVQLGAGNDIVILSGESVADNPDTEANESVRAGFIGGTLDLEEGNDSVSISRESQIDGNILAGEGNDTVTVEDTATVGGSIFLEEGDDVFNAGSNTTINGTVDLGSGNDNGYIDFNGRTIANGTYNLGDGNDVFVIKNTTLTTGITLAGGTSENGSSNISVNGETFTGIRGDNFIFDNTTISDSNIFQLGAGNNTILLRNGSSINNPDNTLNGTGNFNLEVADSTINLTAINLTSGDSSLKISGGAIVNSSVTFGNNNNVISMYDGATINGNVTTGTGQNTFIYSGSGDKIIGTVTTNSTAGDVLILDQLSTTQNEFSDAAFINSNFKTISINGGVAFETGSSIALLGGGAANTVTLSNNAQITDSIIFNSSVQNSLTLSGQSSIIGDINFTSNNLGTDSITLSENSTINGNINVGNGTNSITVRNSVLNGNSFSGGLGSDNLAVQQSQITYSSINLGDGENSIIASGSTINGNVSTGTGNDNIDLADSIINGNLDIGEGNNQLKLNNSTVSGNIASGSGIDQVYLSGNGQINNSIQGFESLTQEGTGTWSLNSDSTFTNSVDINSGTFNLNNNLSSSLSTIATDAVLNFNSGSITGNVTVNGRLNGGGAIIGDLVVGSNATLSPQDVSDDISANSLTLNDGATLDVIYKDVTDDAQIANYKISGNVTNSLSNEGTSINVINDILFEDQDKFIIIEANSGIDSTKYRTTLDSYVLSIALGVEDNNLVGTFSRTAYPDLDSEVVKELLPTAIQLEVVRGLPSISNNPEFRREILTLDNLDRSSFEKSLKQINPSVLANLTNIGLSSHRDFTNHINRRLNYMQFGFQTFSLQGPGGPENEVEDLRDEELNVWVESNFRVGEQDSDSAALGYDFTNYNLTIGTDAYINNNWILGGAFDYSSTDADFDEDAGTTEMTAYSLAAYGKYVEDSLFWDNILSISMNEYQNEREIAGTNTTIDSDSDGMIYSLSSQVGYEFEGKNTYFTPIAGLSYSHSQVDGVSENGSVFAVTTDDQDNDSFLTKLGFRTGYMSLMEDEDYYILELRAFWFHELMDTGRDLGTRFNAGGSGFDVAGIEAENDTFVMGLGFKYEYDRTELKLDYDYEMSDSFNAHKLGVSWVIHF
ncbi:MAG: autotransporter domain-containing protein [Lentisphaeraceae bacterium]|nr:autotransporter domain-containing protein [Lentisphaeraceae bacterium]